MGVDTKVGVAQGSTVLLVQTVVVPQAPPDGVVTSVAPARETVAPLLVRVKTPPTPSRVPDPQAPREQPGCDRSQKWVLSRHPRYWGEGRHRGRSRPPGVSSDPKRFSVRGQGYGPFPDGEGRGEREDPWGRSTAGKAGSKGSGPDGRCFGAGMRGRGGWSGAGAGEASTSRTAC